jgi:plastocyanin
MALALAALAVASVRAAQHVVSQKAKAFSATTLTVKQGDEVVFKNEDDVTHNLFSNTKGFEFNLTQAPGNTSSYAFKGEGTAEVRCAFHPKMKLTVTVAK